MRDYTVTRPHCNRRQIKKVGRSRPFCLLMREVYFAVFELLVFGMLLMSGLLLVSFHSPPSLTKTTFSPVLYVSDLNTAVALSPLICSLVSSQVPPTLSSSRNLISVGTFCSFICF